MPDRFILSSPRAALLSHRRLTRIASNAGIDGIDVEFRNWVGRVDANRAQRVDAMPGSVLRTCASDVAMLGSLLRRPDQEHVAGFTTVIIELPHRDDVRADHATVAEAVRQRRDLPDSSLAIALPAAVGSDGRAHIVRIKNVVRIAEEWNLRIGFDLVRQIETGWEAEAAVHMAAQLLTYVRVPAGIRATRTDRSAVALRTLRACADVRFNGIVSLSLDLPLWQQWRRESVKEILSTRIEEIREILSGRSRPRLRSNDTPILRR